MTRVPEAKEADIRLRWSVRQESQRSVLRQSAGYRMPTDHCPPVLSCMEQSEEWLTGYRYLALRQAESVEEPEGEEVLPAISREAKPHPQLDTALLFKLDMGC